MMTNRRGFFRGLVEEVAHGAMEVARGARELEPIVSLAGPVPTSAASPLKARPRSVRAGAARHCASVDELLGLAADLGLQPRSHELRALACPSVRLTLGDPEHAPVAGSRLGGMPDLASTIAWPHRNGEPLRFLAQLNLKHVTSTLRVGAPLSTKGMLWFFSALDARFGPLQEHPAASHVIFDASDTLAVPRPGDHNDAVEGRSLKLSCELVLPRVWSSSVQAIELDEAEQDAWQKLRQQLAELQSVELADASGDRVTIHRLLGYPDERRGDMPLACELLARGHSLGGEPPRAHPRALEIEPHAARWRMLLQLTTDDDLGWFWGGGRERLYLWIDERDLAKGNFSRVRQFAQ